MHPRNSINSRLVVSGAINVDCLHHLNCHYPLPLSKKKNVMEYEGEAGMLCKIDLPIWQH